MLPNVKTFCRGPETQCLGPQGRLQYLLRVQNAILICSHYPSSLLLSSVPRSRNESRRKQKCPNFCSWHIPFVLPVQLPHQLYEDDTSDGFLSPFHQICPPLQTLTLYTHLLQQCPLGGQGAHCQQQWNQRDSSMMPSTAARVLFRVIASGEDSLPQKRILGHETELEFIEKF